MFIFFSVLSALSAFIYPVYPMEFVFVFIPSGLNLFCPYLTGACPACPACPVEPGLPRAIRLRQRSAFLWGTLRVFNRDSSGRWYWGPNKTEAKKMSCAKEQDSRSTITMNRIKYEVMHVLHERPLLLIHTHLYRTC